MVKFHRTLKIAYRIDIQRKKTTLIEILEKVKLIRA